MLYGYRQPYSIHKKKTFTQTLWKDVEARFETLNYELDGLLPKGKKRKSNCFNER